MKAKKWSLSFLFFILLTGVSLFSFGETYPVANKAETAQQPANEEFESFLNKFTASAVFQYSRIRFPLESPITLSTTKGVEKSYPFTQDKWPLLNADYFIVERVVQEEEGVVYVSRYIVDEPDHKEYEAGYEESELDLRVTFKRIAGKWYVTDCYNAWYSFDLPAEEFQETIKQVQEENIVFKEEHP